MSWISSPEIDYAIIEQQGRSGSVQRIVDDAGVSGVGVQSINGISASNISISGDGTFTTAGPSGSTVTVSFIGTLATIPVGSAGTVRTNLGLGGLAVLNAAAASADTATPIGAAFVQAEVQAILDELRDLKVKLRTALILTP